MFEYDRHVLGAKNFPTCAKYGFQQGGRDQKVHYPSTASTLDRNVYTDDLVKSVSSPQAAITCYQELAETIERSGFDLEEKDLQLSGSSTNNPRRRSIRSEKIHA